ncbi:DUF4007 family protein [Anaeromyxobacter sp. SG17]|uniref:DUF4007 family protein n=1 Tax=Anaeromyxobacter sp. SG17 TaxID=2925405 RepID=UPI001F58A9D3|nr:DUF4007 family protein [Anaeromyxobacter sp. SG17]
MSRADEASQKGSFAGHETFPFRYTWLPKALAFVKADPGGFGADDALVRLGVGKNMVRSMRHWSMACGIIAEDSSVRNNRGRHLCPTPLGESLLGDEGWDPYLEDPGTLWLLHANLVSSPEWATTWYWVFNLMSQPEFTKVELVKWLLAYASERQLSRVSEGSVRRDVDCFVRTYVPANLPKKGTFEDALDCPLAELGLVREFGRRTGFVLSRGAQPSLPDEMVAYAIARQAGGVKGSSTLSLEKVAYSPGSPGRIFALAEDALLARLERLDHVTGGRMTFDDTAGLRQVLIKGKVDPTMMLARYYSSSRKLVMAKAVSR